MIDVRASVRETSPNALARLIARSPYLFGGMTNHSYFIATSVHDFLKNAEKVPLNQTIHFNRLGYEYQDRTHLTLNDSTGELEVISNLPLGKKLEQSGFVYGPCLMKKRKGICLVDIEGPQTTASESTEDYFARNFPGMVPVLT